MPKEKRAENKYYNFEERQLRKIYNNCQSNFQLESMSPIQYRPTLKKFHNLDLLDKIDLVQLVVRGEYSIKEAACRYRCSYQTAKGLIKKFRTNPDFLDSLYQSEKNAQHTNQAISEVIDRLSSSRTPILKVDNVLERLSDTYNLEVKPWTVAKILKDQYGLSFRRPPKVARQSNTDKAIAARVMYAEKMLSLLQQGKTIINMDESWISTTDFIRQSWSRPDQPSNVDYKPLGYRVSLILAIDSRGKLYCALSEANSSSETTKLFLKGLTD